MNTNKDNKEINDTQLDISANEQGLHLELKIPWQRLSPLAKVSGFVLSHLLTIGLTLINLPPSPYTPDSIAPQVENLDYCKRPVNLDINHIG